MTYKSHINEDDYFPDKHGYVIFLATTFCQVQRTNVKRKLERGVLSMEK